MDWLPLIIWALCIGFVAEQIWQRYGVRILEWLCRGFYDGERR